MPSHEEKIKRIASQLQAWPNGQYVSFLRQGVSHQVPKREDAPKGDGQKIYLGDLNDILHIDTASKICEAESGLPFCDLVKETLKQNLVPMCVPELKTITLGGAVSGCSIESMSYKYGGFHDNCLEYEIITGRGEILTCGPGRQPEIFEMIHGTFGTLGLITKIKFKLIEAKPFVHTEYFKYPSLQQFEAAIRERHEKKDCDFMDGIIHGPRNFILCLGNFLDQAPFTSNYQGLNIFYKSTADRAQDYLTTYDYFFRYDTECHWITRNYGLENPLLRLAFGKFVLGSTNILKLAKKFKFLIKKNRPDVVVDIFVPVSNFKKFFTFYAQEFNYYPLWIVPYHIEKMYPWLSSQFLSGVSDKLFIDCAIYGMKQKGDKDYYKLMDDELIKLQGVKTLISHNNYDEGTFWKIYNKEQYDVVKKITDPNNIFKNLYNKTHRI